MDSAVSVGGKRPNSASSDGENLSVISEEKRPRRVKDRQPLSNQANYITVSVPDDGRRTRIALRSKDRLHEERIGEENFLVWTCSKSWRDLKEHANAILTKAEQTVNVASSQVVQVAKTANGTELWLKKYAPGSYMDLVSDEATNRVVLQWFRLWDKGVFGKERKSKSIAPTRDNRQQQQQQQQQPQQSTWNNRNQQYQQPQQSKWNNRNQQHQSKWNNRNQQQQQPQYSKWNNRNQQQQQPQQSKWNNNNQLGASGQASMGPAMDATESWPAQRICLLAGPPGLGKTTLAHIAARHCGYEIVEVNASDDRSANVFRDYLESVVETRGMLNVIRDGDNKQTSTPSKPRPACLILDEIDGAPQAAVDVLIGYVTAGAADAAERSGKQKRRGKKDHELRRPVICICNDQYATSLRNLRRHCFVVTCLPPPPERLVFRIGDIAKCEQIEIDSNAVTQIVDRSHGDIRVCINILQTLKAGAIAASTVSSEVATQQRRHRDVTRITNDQIARLPKLGFNKDVEQSMFDCLHAIFRLQSTIPNGTRFDYISSCIQMNSDHELLVNGMFENYLNARVRDDFLMLGAQMADWLATADTMHSNAMSIAGSEIGYSMTYTTTPLLATACHLMFANSMPGRLLFPKVTMEMRQLQTQRKNQLASFMAGMIPGERVFFSSPSAIIFDLLPSLLDIIQPSLRPVSAQLFSSVEKADIARVVEILASLGLTFVQRLGISSNNQSQWQSRGSQLGYYLEPPVDAFVTFDNKSHEGEANKSTTAVDEGSKNAHCNSIAVWRLSQAVRQLLANDITVYLAKRAAIRCGPLFNVSEAVADPGSKPSEPAANASDSGKPNLVASSLLADKAEMSSGGGDSEGKVQTAISSFFTRTSSSKKNSSFNVLVKSPPSSRARDKIWYRFNEGYSNAVRRPARVKQFL